MLHQLFPWCENKVSTWTAHLAVLGLWDPHFFSLIHPPMPEAPLIFSFPHWCNLYNVIWYIIIWENMMWYMTWYDNLQFGKLRLILVLSAPNTPVPYHCLNGKFQLIPPRRVQYTFLIETLLICFYYSHRL